MRRRDLLATATASAAFVALAGCAGAPLRASRTTDADEAKVEQAFLYGFAVHEFSRTASEFVANIRGRNVLARRSRLLIPSDREVTAPGHDSLYASAFLELSGGPIEVVTPSPGPRYQSITFMNAFSDNFARIGTAAAAEPPGRYWIVGPDWRGDAPAGISAIRSDTNDVWMLSRTLVRGPEDLEAALASQAQITVEESSSRGPIRPIEVHAEPVSDPSDFLDVVNEMLGRSPTDIGQAKRAARCYDAGIRPGRIGVWEELSPAMQAAWTARMPVLIEQLRSSSDYLLPERDGWRRAPNGVGNFGDDDRLRATIARWAFAALPSDEATYFLTDRGADGTPLHGAAAYRFRLPAEGAPVDGFWSITVYAPEPDGRLFFFENSIRRYAINDQTRGLTRDADGALSLVIQAQAPQTEASRTNWLPIPPGRFVVVFRAFQPRTEILQDRWSPPGLVRTPAG